MEFLRTVVIFIFFGQEWDCKKYVSRTQAFSDLYFPCKCTILRKNTVWENRFSGMFETAQKLKFSIKDFFSKCYQSRSFLWIWSHLLKKSFMENFIFCAVLHSVIGTHCKRMFEWILSRFTSMKIFFKLNFSRVSLRFHHFSSLIIFYFFNLDEKRFICWSSGINRVNHLIHNFWIKFFD